MSLFHRKSRGKSRRTARMSTAELVSGLFPEPQAVPVTVQRGHGTTTRAPRRRRPRSTGYFREGARQPMFRVT